MSTLLLSSILLLAVWPAYFLLLRHSDRYQLNRGLLLLGTLVVLLLPQFGFNTPAPAVSEAVWETVDYAVSQTVPAGEEVAIAPKIVEHQPGGEPTVTTAPTPPPAATNPAFPWWTVYYLGLGTMLLILVVRMLTLLTSHLRSRPTENGSYRLLPATNGQAFTFGRRVYVSPDVAVGTDFTAVLDHERVHARQLHTLDVLLSELLLAVLWFHPAAWWLRTSVRANLEYLVDATVVRNGHDRRSYQYALVRQSQSGQALALALPFTEPSLKSRIRQLASGPKHRTTVAVAAVALLFWLSLAYLVVNGRGGDDPRSDASVLPTEIESVEIVFDRLPTPNEYWQVQAIVGQLKHTNFSVYQPCGVTDGSYVLQLNHFHDPKAVFDHPLREGERLGRRQVLSLTKRTVKETEIPEDLPLHSYGYYVPEAYPATQAEYARLPDPESPGFSVYVNGVLLPLNGEPRLRDLRGVSQAHYSHLAAATVTAMHPGAFDHVPGSLAEIDEYLKMPPEERIACLLDVPAKRGQLNRKLYYGGRHTLRYEIQNHERRQQYPFVRRGFPPTDNKIYIWNDEFVTIESLRNKKTPVEAYYQYASRMAPDPRARYNHYITDRWWN